MPSLPTTPRFLWQPHLLTHTKRALTFESGDSSGPATGPTQLSLLKVPLDEGLAFAFRVDLDAGRGQGWREEQGKLLSECRGNLPGNTV